MGQVSAKLRRAEGAFMWWCPACNEMHPLPDGWTFNGDVNAPTFSPSFKHEGAQIEKDASGNWTGRWLTETGEAKTVFASTDKPKRYCCHYIVAAGRVAYCGDCTHAMAGRTIAMPDLPREFRDL
ncbi:MAG TPA: hypothetical protein VKW08_07655 [Xanthobacteraceae bacterium]|jgi:hypothetical protein|nr:hypothetical protein [Xanthobacteraceae bacterium]